MSVSHDDAINWRAALAAISAISVIGITIGLAIPLLSIVLERQGHSASVIGANTAMAGIASLAAAPIGPRIGAMFGLARALALMILVSSACFLAFFYLDHIIVWFVLRFVLHFALTVLFILSEFWISSAAPPARRGFVLGIYATVLSLGVAVGPLLLRTTGSEGVLPFATGAAIALMAILPLLAAWRDGIQVGDESAGGFLRYLWLVPTATGAVLVFGATETGAFALFPVYGIRLGLPEGQIAMMLAMIGFGNVLLQIPIGLWSDRVRDRRIVLASCALIGFAGIALLPFVITNSILAMAVLFVWGGVIAGLYTVGLAHLSSRVPPGALAQANAAFIFAYAAGMLAGPQAIGWQMDATGPDAFAWGLAIGFLAYALLVVARLATPRRA